MLQQDTSSTVCEVCKGTTWILIQKTSTFKRCECYERSQRIERLKNLGIDLEDTKMVKDYKAFDDITKKAKSEVIKFIKNFGSNSGEAICLLGTSGSGKTMLSLAIVKELIKTHSVAYMPYLNVLTEIKSNILDYEYTMKTLRKYMDAELLIIDDLYKDILLNGDISSKINKSDLKYLYEIINYRYLKKKPTIVNSEASPKTMINIDMALASRLFERNVIIAFDDFKYNYRLKDFI
ncbi:MAG: ATP-binding protein, partial [Bacillota bacterium]|nr:ATP-binding protein [Bacillota bacterium]